MRLNDPRLNDRRCVGMSYNRPFNKLGEQVRAAVSNLQGLLLPHESLFPGTAAAVAALAAAAGAEFGPRPGRKARGLVVGKKSKVTRSPTCGGAWGCCKGRPVTHGLPVGWHRRGSRS